MCRGRADQYESVSGTTAAFEHDYFWSVPAAEQFNIYEGPPELTIGQVSELIDHFALLDSEPDRVFSYHLIWIGQMLQAMGSDS